MFVNLFLKRSCQAYWCFGMPIHGLTQTYPSICMCLYWWYTVTKSCRKIQAHFLHSLFPYFEGFASCDFLYRKDNLINSIYYKYPFRSNVLHKSSGIDEIGYLQPHLIECLFLAWFLVFLCLIKGVKSIGKVRL